MHSLPGPEDAYGAHNGSYAPSGSRYLQEVWSEFRRSIGGYSRWPWPLVRCRSFAIGMGTAVILITFVGRERMLGGWGWFRPMSGR